MLRVGEAADLRITCSVFNRRASPAGQSVCVWGGVVLHGADCPLRRRVLGSAVAECGPSSREGRRRQVNQRVFLELRGIALLLGAIARAPAIILINTSHLSGEKGLS